MGKFRELILIVFVSIRQFYSALVGEEMWFCLEILKDFLAVQIKTDYFNIKGSDTKMDTCNHYSWHRQPHQDDSLLVGVEEVQSNPLQFHRKPNLFKELISEVSSHATSVVR